MIPGDFVPKDVRLFASAGSDARAYAKARDLVNRGRKVRFVTKISKTGHVEIEALDADPWAEGWQAYGRRLWFKQNPWMATVLGSALVFPALMWMMSKAKQP